MRRHASLDELADLGVGTLRTRKAVRIEQHLTVCEHCTEMNSQLAAVPSVLSSAQYPALPANLSVRIDTALASEVSLRQASAPATEAGRGELPAPAGGGGNRGRGRGGWRLPGLTGPSLKIATAAAAVVIIGGGGYIAATQLGGGSGSNSASSSSARAPQAGTAGGSGEAVGPRITYGPTGSARSIQTVTADTNFVPAKLGAQATAAVEAARHSGVHSGPAHHVSELPNVSNAASGSPVSRAGLSGTQLEGCVSALAPRRTVLLVEAALFEGKPATIIVAAATKLYQAEVWVVGAACSTARHDVLDHLKLAHI